MRETVAIATIALLLSGCAVTAPVPEGVGGEDQARFELEMKERQWMYSDITDREPPEVETTIVEAEKLSERLYGCLVNAGLGEKYTLDENGMSGTGELTTNDDKAAFYVCSISFMPEASEWGYLSPAELSATYDYYQDWLVPCLAVHDYSLPLAMSRGQMASTPGYLQWNPYDQLGARITQEKSEALQAECPYYPPWLYR